MSDRTSKDQLQLGGMALRNGVLMMGPTSWAVAIRDEHGTMHVTSRPRPTAGESISQRVPMLRGPVRLANMLRVLPQVRSAEPRARLGIESPGMIASLLAGSLATTMLRRRVRSPLVGEFVAGVSSLALTIFTLRAGEVAGYHGAEHKAIGGYEQGIEAALASRQHPRCGTQLALPLLAFSSIATQGALLVAPNNPRSARLTGQLVGMAAATELFRASNTTGPIAPIARAAARVGLSLQTHATTVEPTRAQLDVAEAALDALLEAEQLAAA